MYSLSLKERWIINYKIWIIHWILVIRSHGYKSSLKKISSLQSYLSVTPIFTLWFKIHQRSTLSSKAFQFVSTLEKRPPEQMANYLIQEFMHFWISNRMRFLLQLSPVHCKEALWALFWHFNVQKQGFIFTSKIKNSLLKRKKFNFYFPNLSHLIENTICKYFAQASSKHN